MSQIGSITSTSTPKVYRQPRNGFVKNVAKFGVALLAISSSVVRAAGSLGTQPMNGRYLAALPSCNDLRSQAGSIATLVPGGEPSLRKKTVSLTYIIRYLRWDSEELEKNLN